MSQTETASSEIEGNSVKPSKISYSIPSQQNK